MRAFFKGWRRKVGFLVLAITVSVAGIWVRSFVVIDHFWISPSETSTYGFSTRRGSGFLWVSSRELNYTNSGGRILNWYTSSANQDLPMPGNFRPDMAKE